MENVYVLVTYLAILVLGVGAVLLKIGDIFETKRERKYYQMRKDDAAFWQMKIEQSGSTIGDMILDEKENRWYNGSNEGKERMDEIEKKIDELLEEWIKIDKSENDDFHRILDEMKNGLDRLDENLKKIRIDEEGMDELLPF